MLNTIKYIHLAEIYYKDAEINYGCREASTLEQAKELIAKGATIMSQRWIM